MPTQLNTVGHTLSALVDMLGGDRYAQEWSADILARVEQLKTHPSEHLVQETEQRLAQDLDRVKESLIGRHSDNLRSEKFFFSGFVPPFEQLAVGLYWDNAFKTRTPVFRKMASRYIIERAGRQQYTHRYRASDDALLAHASHSINSILALSPWCEYACVRLWELVRAQQSDTWNPAVSVEHRKAVDDILGITLLVLQDVAASQQIDKAFYDLWIPTPKTILEALQPSSQPEPVDRSVPRFDLATPATHRHDVAHTPQALPQRGPMPVLRRSSSSAASQHPPSGSSNVAHSFSHSDDLLSRRKEALYRF